MSRLRAKCPDCRTFTAVALGTDYQCHACGREWHAGLVRVPRAWGEDGEAMSEAAHLPLDYPETGLVEEDSLELQTLALARPTYENERDWLAEHGCELLAYRVPERIAA